MVDSESESPTLKPRDKHRACCTLGRLAKLTIYSYVPTMDYIRKIRLLSKAERILTENSAIARENKIAVINLSRSRRARDGQILSWLGLLEKVQLKADESCGLVAQQIDREVARILKLAPPRL